MGESKNTTRNKEENKFSEYALIYFIFIEIVMMSLICIKRKFLERNLNQKLTENILMLHIKKLKTLQSKEILIKLFVYFKSSF